MSASQIQEKGLEVLLDIRQPQAYLALHPTAALGADCGIPIDWIPVVVPPLKAPSEARPDDDRGVRHRRNRAQAIAREIETYAGVQKLVIEGYYRDCDPRAFNLSWLWVRERYSDRLFDFLSDAFRKYWGLEFDISDDDAVGSFLDHCGFDRPAYESWAASEGPALAEAVAEEVQSRGVTRSPGYLIEDQVFIGRQHLPMIRWISEGRRERGPI